MELNETLKTIAFGPTYPLYRAIYEKLSNTDIEASSGTNLADVRAETERQENEMKRLEAQAKVAQEMAIATRIQNAAEVEIEEFYEYAGEGKIGLTADEKTLTIGASGSGKRVSKRVYRFTGTLPVELGDLSSSPEQP